MKPMKKLTALALACALGLSACAGPGGASSHSAPRQDFTSVPPGAGSTQEGAPAQAMRYRSMWFSYLEWPMLDTSSAEAFTASVDTVLDHCVSLGLNCITVQVRPFADATYESGLFPWSHVVTGTQGQERNGDLSSRMMTQVMFALDKAGETHQDNVWFYDIQLHEKEKRENYIESHMHQALENGEFRLYLQPKIDLKDGSLAGAEALVRWITDEGKMMFPNDFIPLFEKNGFCTRLDMYMMECACRHIHHWMECGIRPVPISVNQSRLLFYEADYPERLKELVDRYEIPAGLITLEILEGLAIGNVEEMNERISLLQKAGFRISMDDFGAGYSSLNVMGALKIDELKLDRAFLMEVSQGNNLRQKAVMEMVIALTRRLRIATVAEGVETKEDEALIRELGCDAGQGYYYSRPVSAEEFDGRFIGAGL